MEREFTLFDLGTATVETKGRNGAGPDDKLGQIMSGLSDD
jgi:hypothetical protein